MHCKKKIVKRTHSKVNAVIKSGVDLNCHDAHRGYVHVITNASYLLQSIN